MHKQNDERLEPINGYFPSCSDANKEDSESESFLWYSVITKIRTEIENYQDVIYIPDLAPVA